MSPWNENIPLASLSRIQLFLRLAIIQLKPESPAHTEAAPHKTKRCEVWYLKDGFFGSPSRETHLAFFFSFFF